MKIKVDTFPEDWNEVKKAALVTIHKKAVSDGNDIPSEWKEAMIQSRHSPIREFRIKITIEGIPRWIADQLVRHNVGVNNFMGTFRPDRGNVKREDQTMADLTVFKQSYNIESFLTLCSARLCVGSVSKETRELVEEIVEVLREKEPEIAKYCVPPCISSLGCKELAIRNRMGIGACNYLDKFLKYSIVNQANNFELGSRLETYQSFRIRKERKNDL